MLKQDHHLHQHFQHLFKATTTNTSEMASTNLKIHAPLTNFPMHPNSSDANKFTDGETHLKQQHIQSPTKQQQPQSQLITTTKMGSRRIFSAQFKLQVLDSYRNDNDCKGNQRATARKYGIHRRQIQKWLQCEQNLRSSVVANNNNNNNSSNNNNNTSDSHSKVNPSKKSSLKQKLESAATAPSALKIGSISIKPAECLQKPNGNNFEHSNTSFGSLKSMLHSERDTAQHAENSSYATMQYQQNNNNNNSHLHATHQYQPHHQHHRHQQQQYETSATHPLCLDTTTTRHNVALNHHHHHYPIHAISGHCSITNSHSSTQNTGFSTSNDSLYALTHHQQHQRDAYACNAQIPKTMFTTHKKPVVVVDDDKTDLLASSSSALQSQQQQQQQQHHSSAFHATSPSASLRNPSILPHFPDNHHHHILHQQQQPQSTHSFNENTNIPCYDMLPQQNASSAFINEFKAPHQSLPPPPQLPSLPPMLAQSHIPSILPPAYGYFDHPVTMRPSFGLCGPGQQQSPVSIFRGVSFNEQPIERPEDFATVHRPPTPENSAFIENQSNVLRSSSPIDLTKQQRDKNAAESTLKQRQLLPLPSVERPYMRDNSTEKPKNATDNSAKAWDLSCSRKRKATDDQSNDDDEGISCDRAGSNVSTKPTPPKQVKLFKPYLLSSDDEDDDVQPKKINDGKKCPISDEHKQKQPVIWNNHMTYDQLMPAMRYSNLNTHEMVNFRKQHEVGAITISSHRDLLSSPPASVSSQYLNVPTSSYWLNHGSPVSGYDSASSTFSDCNCNDPVCNRSVQAASPPDSTKLPSPVSTVASYSSDEPEFITIEDSNLSSSNGDNNSSNSNSINNNNNDSEKYGEAISVATEEKNSKNTIRAHYRRQILAKWSHEEESELPSFIIKKC